MQKRDIRDYETYIVDVDGTLYFQPALRKTMACRLLSFFLLHPWKFKDGLVLWLYRKVREDALFSNESDFEDKQIQFVATKIHVTAARVRNAIDYWMQEVPLSLIYRNRDQKLIDFLSDMREKGKKVYIYSDYPFQKKLDALQLIVDGGFFSGDGIVRGQKPDKAGIEAILHSIQSPVDETIFIGDRLEKDGKSAEAVGMDYMILDRTPKRLDIGGKNGYL